MAEPPTVRAAGGVLWRPRTGASGVEVAVVHRPRYDDWSLPKGKLDDGEPEVVAACREVAEETGFSAVVGRALGTSRYTVVQGGRPTPKTVRWWALRAEGGSFRPSREVDELCWLPVGRVAGLLTSGRDSDVLARFRSGPPRTRTLVLVRHATAGRRAAWAGDDDARPLDDGGVRQAQALARVLPLYGVRRLVSAPLERCVATLRPYADAAGLPVALDDALSARGQVDSPERATKTLSALVADDVPTAVCSQGEVLPAIVLALAAGSGLELGELRAAKGSLWVLSFDDAGRLLDADYTESLLG